VKVWVVRANDGATLLAVLERAGEGASAIEEGRIFVGKKRAVRDQPVKVGDAIRIGPRSERARIEVLFEREGVIACIKPAGLPTVPDHAGAAHSLVALVEKQTGRKNLRVTSRLDREVSGVVMFAIDEAAETRLREARSEGAYARRYIAIAAGHAVVGSQGEWSAAIGRAKSPLLRQVGGVDPKPSLTKWRVTAITPDALLLAVDPETGRTHQIRVHSAHAGWPLLGDRDYGPGKLVRANGTVVAPSRIALHAARVAVAGLNAEAPIPEELRRLWSQLGGDPGAFAG
jgi:23S rRNA-/tRNA-specific pseudouridylate synthase